VKVFKNPISAEKSYCSKDMFYLNSNCPYRQENRLCGSWCALFYLSPEEHAGERNISAYVILGCKVDQKMLYVNEIIED